MSIKNANRRQNHHNKQFSQSRIISRHVTILTVAVFEHEVAIKIATWHSKTIWLNMKNTKNILLCPQDVFLITTLYLCNCGAKNCTIFILYSLNNFAKSRSILIIFDVQIPERICNKIVTTLSTSPNDCHYTTSWNTTCVNLLTVMQAVNVMKS